MMLLLPHLGRVARRSARFRDRPGTFPTARPAPADIIAVPCLCAAGATVCWRGDERLSILAILAILLLRSLRSLTGPPGSSSRGRLPSPSSHRTGLVGLTSGSSGRWGPGFPVFRRRSCLPSSSKLPSNDDDI